MILFTRISQNGELKQLGIPVQHVQEINFDTPDVTWLKYWSAQDNQVRSCKVQHSLSDIQVQMFKARHGKAPAKGLFEE